MVDMLGDGVIHVRKVRGWKLSVVSGSNGGDGIGIKDGI
jgi:hypothetical protein